LTNSAARGDLTGQVALVTGSARRLGAAIAERLHGEGMQVAVHYRGSENEATSLCERLNDVRAGSATVHQGDLCETDKLESLIEEVVAAHGGLNVLVNNASSFYPTDIGLVSEEQWDDLMASNLKAPFFLSQASANYLRTTRGCIVNLVDIYGERPLSGHPVYSIAKAGLIMQTKALAAELGPEIRVNGIAPGPILQHSDRQPDQPPMQLSATGLKRWGKAEEIADAALFLVRDATYTSGAILPVDGGRLQTGF